MDIHLLVVEAGNSKLKLGVFTAGELVYSRRLGTEGNDRANWAGVLGEAWGRLDGNAAEVAGASSNPSLNAEVEKVVREVTGQPVQWVGDELDLPIAVQTDEPARTGVDRVLNVAAAFEQLKKACCVVDVGTAVTVDLCDESGNFVGGVIAPGPHLQAKSLHEAAPHLPVVEPAPIEAGFGKNTDEAIRGGIVLGIRGLVRQVCETYAMTLDAWPEVIATGGDAHALFGDMPQEELIHAISPDLTLYGIALAYTNHHIKHGT